ncbi:multiple sugar transport system permease protein [Alkalihalobacillus xiaoxiensis]|uniref:Multiple sugar transport system permease protein n=1 Tax=Shouchella xiaoxiensis TaxID=766895 RepID=A0ABS2SZX9_9BACI|nr:carbohydrate ABC transporter permease [Shouchella xiaoxiensis]MBM7841078.1 multiple sugar transport system permease protein [Shouchella xiaoxiensis]
MDLQTKKLQRNVNLKRSKLGTAKVRKFLLGSQDNSGLLMKLLVYSLLIGIGYVYLYPVLYMGVFSLKSLEDLLNPLVNWIPTGLYWENFIRALEVLNFWPSLWQTLYVTVIPAAIQTAVAAVVGYGFARFQFPLKKTLFVLVLATFIIPPQVTLIPRYVFFNELGLLGSIQSFVLPALFGQGINSAIFILIFYQFFRMLPDSLEEAAQLDGAGNLRIFFTIALPMAVPAIIISFLFSLVWYWNETGLAAIYFGNSLTTLPLELQRFSAVYEQMYGGEGSFDFINEGIQMAGTLITILPLLIIYFIAQRWFVEGVDRSGIAGE